MIWAARPNPQQSITQPIEFNQTNILSSVQQSTPVTMDERLVVMEWPKSVRIGEQAEIWLTFKAAKGENPAPSTYSTDIYWHYNLMAEAKYEVAGFKVDPANPTRESMPPGRTVRFKWVISTDRVGSYSGKVWLSLRLLPRDGGPASQVPVFIQDVVINSYSLFGMTEAMAYLMGGAGVMLSVVIAYGDIIKLVKRLRIKNNTKDPKDTKDF